MRYWIWVTVCAVVALMVMFGLEATFYPSIADGIHLWCTIVACVVVIPLEVYLLNWVQAGEREQDN